MTASVQPQFNPAYQTLLTVTGAASGSSESSLHTG